MMVLAAVMAGRSTLVFTNSRRTAERLTARINEICGKDTKAVITLPYAPAKACVTDLEGNKIGKAEIDGNKITVDLAPYKLIQLNISK